MSDSLTDFYDKLKTDLSQDRPAANSNLVNVADGTAWRNQAARERDKLKEGCCKRILLDIYCKILPLDQDYIDGNQGQMKSDVDSFLANKNTTAAQYLTSGYEKTNAPLLEFLIRSTDTIGAQFMKEADETLKDAQDNNVQIPPPESDVNNKETQNQLVDVQKDTEYQTFIDKLKEKTVNKIVADVSKIIADKKEEKEMTFNPTPDEETVTESAVSIGMDYIHQKLWKENVEMSPVIQEQMIGLAIRESTLNQLDIVFAQPYAELAQFSSRMRFGKGVLINESAVSYLKEAADSETVKRYEPLYKETDGGKYDVSNYEKVAPDGKKTPMTDSDAKKVLDPNAYKSFQNKSRAITEGVDFFQEKVSDAKSYESLTPDERKIADQRFGKIECSIMKDKKGYFARTHRARSKSYPTLEQLPKKDVNFISTTS